MGAIILTAWLTPIAGDLLAETLAAHRASREAFHTLSCRVLLECKYPHPDGRAIHRKDDALWWYGPNFMRYKFNQFRTWDRKDEWWKDGHYQSVCHYGQPRAALGSQMVAGGKSPISREFMHVELHAPYRCALFVINNPWTLTCYPLEQLVEKADKVKRVARQTVDGRNCVVIELFLSKAGKLPGAVDANVTLYLDERYNFLIWKEVVHLAGKLFSESEVVEFAEPLPGAFFPIRYKHMNTPDGLTEHRTAEIRDLVVNQPLPREVLEFRYPHGIKVMDSYRMEAYPVDELGQQIGPARRYSNAAAPPPLAAVPPEQRGAAPGSLWPSETEAGSVWPWVGGFSFALLAVALAFYVYGRWRTVAC